MALDALESACDDVQKARYALKDALNERDQLVQDAKAADIPKATIARRTGMSVKTIDRILTKRLDKDEAHMTIFDSGAHLA